MPKKPTCLCGECKKCKHRRYMREYLRNQTPEQKARRYEREQRWKKERRPPPPPPPSPEEIAQREAERRERLRANWRKKKVDPVKKAARTAISNAIRDGRLNRGACEVCGEADAHAHHDDYTKPFDVRWLCPEHHAAHHRQEATA